MFSRFKCVNEVFVLPDGLDTSRCKFMYRMFSDLHWVDGIEDYKKYINLGGINSRNVIRMGYMFAGLNCMGLDISSLRTDNVTEMQGMFSDCRITKNLDFSHFKTSKVTDMSSMFSEFKGGDLDLSSFDVSSVTFLRSMFSQCRANSINISSFYPKNCTDFKFMFEGCNLDSLDLRSFRELSNADLIAMFESSTIGYLDMRGLKFTGNFDFSDMFAHAEIECLDIRGIDISNSNFMDRLIFMFVDCRIGELLCDDYELRRLIRKCIN